MCTLTIRTTATANALKPLNITQRLLVECMCTYVSPIAKIKLRPNRRPKFILSFHIEGWGSMMRQRSTNALFMFRARPSSEWIGHRCGTPQRVLKGRHSRLTISMEATQTSIMYVQRKYEPHRKKRSSSVNIRVRSASAEIFANIWVVPYR